MVLDQAGRPQYLGERKAQVAAWFGETLVDETAIDLCCSASRGTFQNLVS